MSRQTKNSWLFSSNNERRIKTGESLFKSAAQLRNWPLTAGLMEYYDSSKKACKNHMEWHTNTFNVPIRNSHSWWCSHSCMLLGRSLKWRREPSLGSFTIIIMLTKTCWWWSNFIERNNISLFWHLTKSIGSSIFSVSWEINFMPEFYNDLQELINVVFAWLA